MSLFPGRRPLGGQLTVVLSLALGIAGAATAFTALSATGILSGLWGDGRLYWVLEEHPEWGAKTSPSPRVFETWQDHLICCPLEGIALADGSLRGTEGGRRVRTAAVSSGFLHMIRVRPLAGSLLPEMAGPERAQSALLSRRLARQRFGSPEEALGRTVVVNRRPFQVAGVVDRRLLGRALPGTEVDVVLPLETEQVHRVQALLRLSEGVSRAQAEAEMRALHEGGLEQGKAGTGGAPVLLAPGDLLDTRRLGLSWAAAAAGLLLLAVAGSNVAHLLAAQRQRERQEIAVRRALGAGRRLLVLRQAKRALAVTAAAGGLGALASAAVLVVMRPFVPPELGFLAASGPDPEALAAAVALGAAMVLAAGLFPLLRGREAGLARNLAGAPPASAGRTRTPTALGRAVGRLHVVSLAAVAAAAAIACWLLGAGLHQLGEADLGFEEEGLQAVTVVLPGGRSQGAEQCASLASAAVERLGSLPGVVAAAVAIPPPPVGALRLGEVSLEGAGGGARTLSGVGAAWIGPGYAAALQQPVLAGRDLVEEDLRPGAGHVLVSEALTRALGLSARDAVGRTLVLGEERETIVGVLGDVTVPGAAEPFGASKVYWPLERSCPSFTVLARTAPDRLPLLQEVTRSLDPDAVVEAVPLAQRLREPLSGPRFLLAVLSGLTLLSLVLTLLGVYGVVGSLLARERAGIALRLALGATEPALQRWILWRSLGGCLAGFALGLLASYPLGQLLTARIGVASGGSLPSRLGVLALLLVAAALPAWRAARKLEKLQPAEALRRG